MLTVDAQVDSWGKITSASARGSHDVRVGETITVNEATSSGLRVSYPAILTALECKDTQWGPVTYVDVDSYDTARTAAIHAARAARAAKAAATPKPAQRAMTHKHSGPCRRCGTYCYGDCTA